MKKMWGYARLFPLVILSACATAPEPDHDVEMKLAEAISDCYTAEGEVKKAAMLKLTDPKDVLLSQSISALENVATKGMDKCAQIVTNNELQKVAMQENTKQIVSAVDGGKSVAGNLVVGVLGWKGLDILPELFNGTGAAYTFNSKGDLLVNESLNSPTVGPVSGGGVVSNLFNRPIDNSVDILPAATETVQ